MRFANGLRRTCFIAGLFSIGTAEFLGARSASGQPDGFRSVRLAPEMLEACNGSAAGDDCTVTLKGNAMNGTCRAGPTADAPLACVPKAPPPGISAAVAACKDRAAGASCTVYLRRPHRGRYVQL
jgi:hypothetical protein